MKSRIPLPFAKTRIAVRAAAVLAAVALAAVLPGRAHAQLQLQGSRVKILAPPLSPPVVEGTVTDFNQSALVVRDTASGTERTVPLHSILRLQISKGMSRGASGRQRARMLAFLGGAIGAIAGIFTKPDQAARNGAIGAGAGIVLGAGLGALWGSSAPYERWEYVARPFGYDPRADAATVAPQPVPPSAPAAPTPAPAPPTIPAPPPPTMPAPAPPTPAPAPPTVPAPAPAPAPPAR